MESKVITKYNSSVCFVVYFAVLASIGIFIRDIPQQPDIFSNIFNFMGPPNGYALSDPTYFVTGALDIYRHGWIQPENMWLIHLWPPGFMILEAAALRVFGENAPFILVLAILSALASAGMLSLLRRYLSVFMPLPLATALPVLPFCFPITRIFLLEPIGLILGEAFSVAFFISAVLLVLLAERERSWKKAILAGACFGLSAYFRSQYETLVNFTSLAAVPLIVGVWLWTYRHRKMKTPVASGGAIVRVVLMAVVAAQLVMLPWRLRNLNDVYVKDLSWVQTQALIYRNAGQTDKQLIGNGATWIVLGGGNLACELEPSYCGKSDGLSFYRAFFDHVGEWYSRKAPLTGEYWFSSLINLTVPTHPSTLVDKAVNLLLLLFVVATWPLLWVTRRNSEAILLTWICVGFYACFFVIFTFVQFETRYFYLMKIFSVFTTMVLGGLAWRSRKTARQGASVAVMENSA